jgi:16S rRNA processing protein RimM
MVEQGRPATEPSLVLVARLGRPHGLRGEIVLESVSLTAEELERVGTFTWRGPDGSTRPLVLRNVRGAASRPLAHFTGVADRDQAATLTRGELWAEPNVLPDPGPDAVYTFQIMGLRVVLEDGRELGVVADVLRTGAHPVWIVRGARELMIPAAPTVVKHVDLAAGVITVALPAGLEEL